MSTLWMVRHGQASFGASNYDQLSELGIKQSQVLGEYWARRAIKLDAVFTGEQERQKQTLTAVVEEYREARLSLPEPAVMSGFNEYNAQGIMTMYFPKLLQEDKQLQEIMSRSGDLGSNTKTGRKAFQEAFEIVMNHWIEGRTEIAGIESWRSFKTRVVADIKKIIADYPEGKTVAVFTSGGPISAALEWALKITPKVALELAWVVKNASITEFKFKSDKFTLTGFNLTPHFNDETLVTYR